MIHCHALSLTALITACVFGASFSPAKCEDIDSERKQADDESEESYAQTNYKTELKVGYLRFQNGDTAYLKQELQIESDQSTKLQKLIREHVAAKRSILERSVEANAALLLRLKEEAELSLELDIAIDEVLDKKQARRLNQIVNQTYFRQYHEDRSGLATPLLYLNQQDVEQEVISNVKKVYETEFAEYCAERKKLRNEKLQEILEVLPEEKRKKFDELLGQPVDWNDPTK